MARHTVVVALPPGEQEPVAAELRTAGFDAVTLTRPDELEALLASRREVAVAILDGETDFDTSLEYWALLHEDGRSIPALMVVSPQALDRFGSNPDAGASLEDEYFTRPYSVDALRWRVEAMCIRSQTVDDGSGPIIQSGPADPEGWSRRGTIVAVFNPKGGVGKTTVATNLAAALAVRKDQRVMLVDADTVTGHVATSLALEDVSTVADAWRDEHDGSAVGFEAVASDHPSGLRVVTLSSSPLHTDVLRPERVGEALTAARRGVDFVIVDLHPSYSGINQAVFERADRIIVPVTPDVPAIRAAVQLRDVADEVGLRDRLAMVINRANSGVSVADMERTVGIETLALIRSGGMLFVRAANEGRTVIDLFPKERITEDFDALADRVLGRSHESPAPRSSAFRFLGRFRAPARA